MEYTSSSRTPKKISKIGFGSWQLGNTKEFTPMSMEEGIALVQQALDAGITFFDTAPNYAQGKSEEILGQVLKGMEDEIYINTKAGHGPDGSIDFSLPAITASIERSLKVLGWEALDSVVLHNPEFDVLQGKTGHYALLEDLKKEGLIHGYGVSIDTPEEMEAVLKNSDADIIELLFNIIHQSPKQWFDEIRDRDILLVTKVPLDSGWLTGKFNKHSTFEGIRSRWTKEDIQVRSEIIGDIKDIVQLDDLVPAALSFILSFDAVSAVIPGIRTPKQLESNVAALDYEFSAAMKEELENYYASHLASKQIPW